LRSLRSSAFHGTQLGQARSMLTTKSTRRTGEGRPRVEIGGGVKHLLFRGAPQWCKGARSTARGTIARGFACEVEKKDSLGVRPTDLSEEPSSMVFQKNNTMDWSFCLKRRDFGKCVGCRSEGTDRGANRRRLPAGTRKRGGPWRRKKKGLAQTAPKTSTKKKLPKIRGRVTDFWGRRRQKRREKKHKDLKGLGAGKKGDGRTR